MAKATNKEPMFKLQPQYVTTINDVLLRFRRRHGARLPSFGNEVAANARLQEFAQSATMQNYERLVERLKATDGEIAVTELQLIDWRDELAAVMVTDADAEKAEQGVVRTEETLRTLKARQRALRDAIPPARIAAKEAYAAWESNTSAELKDMAKPVREEVIARLEAAISPLLDELHAATRTFEDSGNPLKSFENIASPMPDFTDPQPAPVQHNLPVRSWGHNMLHSGSGDKTSQGDGTTLVPWLPHAFRFTQEV